MDFKEIYQKYASEGLELKDILKVWKEERLSPERIRQQLSTDTGIRISSGQAKELYKIARTDDFNFKTAEVGVSWELGEREGADGIKKFYIIRKEKEALKEEPNKTASVKIAETELLYDHISITPKGTVLYPVQCPAPKNNIEDSLKDKEGKPVCINSGLCKYFVEATFSELNHNKDIICSITTQEK